MSINKCDLCESRDKDKRDAYCYGCPDNFNNVSHFKLTKSAETILKTLDITLEELLEKNRG